MLSLDPSGSPVYTGVHGDSTKLVPKSRVQAMLKVYVLIFGELHVKKFSTSGVNMNCLVCFHTSVSWLVLLSFAIDNRSLV